MVNNGKILFSSCFDFQLISFNKYKQKAENKIKENRNFYLGSVAEPVEATTQINPFGKNILKHTLYQFASEFPLCSLNNIVLSLKSLRFKNNSDS